MKRNSVFKSEQARQEILAVYDAILARWPVPYEKLEVPTRHGRTGLLAFGPASHPSLLLLHGSSSNSAMWLGDAAVLSGRFRVWAVDLPGEPGMSEALRRPLAGPAYAEWLEDVMSNLGLAKAALAGISLGGWMALKFAVTHPERVDRLAMPVLLVAGARDALLNSRASAGRLKKLLPHARVELLAEAGHVLIDQNEKLIEFLSG